MNRMKPLIIIILLSIFSGIVSNSINSKGIPYIYKTEIIPGETSFTLEQAKHFFDRNEARFIDAREETEFQQERIPYALNIPYNANREKKMQLLRHIPRDRNIIVYCSDAFCTAAERVAGEMRFAGYKRVAVMTEGIIGWIEAGYPVEASW